MYQNRPSLSISATERSIAFSIHIQILIGFQFFGKPVQIVRSVAFRKLVSNPHKPSQPRIFGILFFSHSLENNFVNNRFEDCLTLDKKLFSEKQFTKKLLEF